MGEGFDTQRRCVGVCLGGGRGRGRGGGVAGGSVFTESFPEWNDVCVCVWGGDFPSHQEMRNCMFQVLTPLGLH